MKKSIKLATLIPAVCLSLLMTACTTTENTAQNGHGAAGDHQMSAYHLGPITPQDLLTRFHIFAKNKKADQTQISDLEVLDFANQLNNKKLVVVFGTWCHDSQREIPRLLNLLDKVNAQHSDIKYDIEFIAAAPYEKRDPALVKKYDLSAVPTIMLFDQDQEVGRVVENTPLSLAAAFVNMKL
ncbi:MAG: thioredoxin family protein [Psychrosphaera sp.]|nr:thioredoxin family protein [Psychrosphaera sp.]